MSPIDIELLTSADVLAINRLIEKLVDADSAKQSWRAVLVMEVPKLMGGELAVSYLMKTNLDPTDIGPRTIAYAEEGGTPFWKRYLAEGDVTSNPMTQYIMPRFGTDFVFSRPDVINDQDWYGSSFYKDVLVHSGWDHSIVSQVAIYPPGVVDGLSVGRDHGGAAFTAREVMKFHFLHQELARLWRKQSPLMEHELPKRQRDTLDGIRRGQSRKAIAESMGVSEHTVHSYEKALFEYADVSGRAELLAKISLTTRPRLMP